VQSRNGITAPIASATNLDQLKDLISSVDLALGAESIELLDRASA
jgi:aryl-alcohol dehydrogenase-like predicted oxidoreductase